MKWRNGVSYSSQDRRQRRPLTMKLAVTVLQVLIVICQEDYATPDLLIQQHTAGGRMLPSVGVGNGEADTFGPMRGRFYREDGRAVFCPAGTYGETVGLREEACSGVCPAGWYCPTGTINPFSLACGGPQFYCPEQSRRPLPIDRGHYAVALEFDSQGQPGGHSSQKRCPIGRFCVEGISLPCPAGRFGASQLLTNPSCTGPCKAGHFCPEGSYRADQHVCGNTSVYCPEGSEAPTLASEGFYTVQGDISGVDKHPWHGIAETRTTQVKCELGFYCMDGVRRPCPPGTYGDASGLSTPACSGPCDAGYTCGEGATSPTEAVCGGSGEFFCPEGSSSPSLASAGYYTISKSLRTNNPSLVADLSFTRTAEVLCEPGYWCSRGLRHPCEPGTFGGVFGMTQRNCSGPCSPGYTCGNVSVSPEKRPCGNPSVYCPGGNSEPLVVSVGYYSVHGKGATTRIDQAVAPVGSYAAQGMLFACPPGRYGTSQGLSSPLCSGECSPGFYCPTGSISPKERACGGATLFCPAGSGWPIRVDEGFYTTDYSTTPEQESCPPGYFRNTSFPHGTDPTKGEPSAIVTTIPLSPCHLCPEGTFKDKTGDHPDLCLPCEEHTAKSSSTRTSCLCRRISGGDITAEFLYFNTTSAKCQNVTASFRPPTEVILEESIFTRYHQQECEPGHFCVDGVRFPCPAGRFGANARESSPECDGACAEGWYCPEASVSSTEFPCGAANLYCPSGSSAPIFVDPGFYTIGGYGDDDRAVVRRPDEGRGAAFRGDVALCPPGWYCTGDGGGVKCPPGLYGSEVGLSDPQCSGTCFPGYFCPSGSTSPFEQKCGGTGLYCPAGSSAPIKVSTGYYGVHAGPRADLLASMDPLNETHSAQVLCEPGFFCGGGLKEACPPGTFLWQYGESSRASCMPCKAGYYCPAQEPPRPSVVSTLVECGSPALFCPAGSVKPTTVGAGFYSVGGGSNGTTRISQVLCEPGHFCREGLKSPCPRGTFGATSGLHDEGCSGLCPAGAACPEGTVNPIPCKEGFYAGGGAVACSPCPGRKAREGERCRHSRRCCV